MCNLKQFTIVHGFMDAVWISCGDIGCGHEVRVGELICHNERCNSPFEHVGI